MSASSRSKVVALGLGGVLVTGATLAGVGHWRTSSFADQAQRDAVARTGETLDQTATGVHDVVATQGESTGVMVDTTLRTAGLVARQAGGLRQGGGRVTWRAVDQVDRSVRQVVLPRLEVGGTWLGQNETRSGRRRWSTRCRSWPAGPRRCSRAGARPATCSASPRTS